MNLRPLHNKVVIERIESSTMSAGGIIINRSGEPDRAKVLAIGPEVGEVSVGDIVLLDWNKATESNGLYVVSVDNIVFVYGE